MLALRSARSATPTCRGSRGSGGSCGWTRCKARPASATCSTPFRRARRSRTGSRRKGTTSSRGPSPTGAGGGRARTRTSGSGCFRRLAAAGSEASSRISRSGTSPSVGAERANADVDRRPSWRTIPRSHEASSTHGRSSSRRSTRARLTAVEPPDPATASCRSRMRTSSRLHRLDRGSAATRLARRSRVRALVRGVAAASLSTHPDFAAEGSFAILHGDEPVGWSVLSADRRPGRGRQRDAPPRLRVPSRPRARALAKVAQRAGPPTRGSSGVTDNDETNARDAGDQRRLGYRSSHGAVSWLRASGNAFRASAGSTWAVTQTGVVA